MDERSLSKIDNYMFLTYGAHRIRGTDNGLLYRDGEGMKYTVFVTIAATHAQYIDVLKHVEKKSLKSL